MDGIKIDREAKFSQIFQEMERNKIDRIVFKSEDYDIGLKRTGENKGYMLLSKERFGPPENSPHGNETDLTEYGIDMVGNIDLKKYGIETVR